MGITEKVLHFLRTCFNTFPSIKLTLEIENGKLPILDDLVIRNNGKLEIDDFRKNISRYKPRYFAQYSDHCTHQTMGLPPYHVFQSLSK